MPPYSPTLLPPPSSFAQTLDFALSSQPIDPQSAFKLEDLHDPPPPPHQIPKPITALGPICFSGFYLVSLTRTLIRNTTVPKQVRHAFLAPQLHFGFTIRDKKERKWKHLPTVQISYHALTKAGEWISERLGVVGVGGGGCLFKAVKDALQRRVTEAWKSGDWAALIQVLNGGYAPVDQLILEQAMESDPVCGRGVGTPLEYFGRVNCHKGAADIRRDVDGAISARESLKWVLAELGLGLGDGLSGKVFREQVSPLWRLGCEYVRAHSVKGCCKFYEGGYFKKIMVHSHLYGVEGVGARFHVRDLFEGLDEVIKVWSNPTGMCVREAKCAAGLRYNVDKSFQSGIRSYSKAKFLEAAPSTARELLEVERQLFNNLQLLVESKAKRFAKCKHALRNFELRNVALSQRPLPLELSNVVFENGRSLSMAGNGGGGRKRKRSERDGGEEVATPREQKRKHAHLSLKRKEDAERRVKAYLELLKADCERQRGLLEFVARHGEQCDCVEHCVAEVEGVGNYPTSANVPVA